MSCNQQRANMNIITKYGVIILSTLTTLTINPSTAQTEELLLAETNAFTLSQPVETRTVVTLLEEMIQVKANVEEQNALKPMPKVKKEVKKEVKEVRVVKRVAEPEEVFWTIQYGDTLNDIAEKHQVSTLDIQYNNEHITDINNIVVGETYLVGGTVFQEAPENWTAPIVEPEVVEEPIIEDVYYPEAVEEVVETYVAPEPVKQEPAPVSNSYQVTVEATGYSTMQPVLSDYTSTGVNLHQNPWVIAIDPVYYDYGTTVEIPGYGTFTMNDSGGDIKGPNRIDIHFPTVEQALAFGRRTITMTVYK